MCCGWQLADRRMVLGVGWPLSAVRVVGCRQYSVQLITACLISCLLSCFQWLCDPHSRSRPHVDSFGTMRMTWPSIHPIHESQLRLPVQQRLRCEFTHQPPAGPDGRGMDTSNQHEHEKRARSSLLVVDPTPPSSPQSPPHYHTRRVSALHCINQPLAVPFLVTSLGDLSALFCSVLFLAHQVCISFVPPQHCPHLCDSANTATAQYCCSRSSPP